MFSLSELAPLNQHQNRSKLLKPWWEVFMDYLVVLMLMTSVLACTEQLSRDRTFKHRLRHRQPILKKVRERVLCHTSLPMSFHTLL
uniref:LRRC8 pannexin-like TM region domain-containing protein n=1 Tax=Lates calcarifer TaxID=8187 RepID=A0A4W6EIN7_LATCA